MAPKNSVITTSTPLEWQKISALFDAHYTPWIKKLAFFDWQELIILDEGSNGNCHSCCGLCEKTRSHLLEWEDPCWSNIRGKVEHWVAAEVVEGCAGPWLVLRPWMHHSLVVRTCNFKLCTFEMTIFIRYFPCLVAGMTILIHYFPCLVARFFPHEDCSIRPLAPLFAYLWVWNSLIRQKFGSRALIRWFSSMRFSFDQEGFLSPLQSSFVVSRWPLLDHLRQVPPPTLPFHLHQSSYWVPSTMTGCHTNTATAPLSACLEAPVKTLPIQANLSWIPLPLVPLCTAAFFFPPQDITSCSYFAFLSELCPAVTWPWDQ